ncbi:hypothetical protein L9F63_008304, partial [Diploptera punctata]
MSLETLLEAARYVELQEAQRLQQSSSISSSSRGVNEEEPATGGFLSFSAAAAPPPPPPPAASSSQHQPPPPPPSRPAHHQHVSNGGHTPQQPLDSDDSKEFQKRAAGTREVHNKLEKNRRAHLKECFELLKRQLPVTQDEKKSSNLSILHSALRHIQTLRRKEREFEHEMERLAREKIAAQQRLAMLKKELSAQWDHIDFNTLLPDSAHVLDDPRNRDHVSHTTSTATEREEPVSDAEEPLTKCGVMYSSTSSLSSAATACSPPQLPPPPPPPPPDVHGHGGEGPKSTTATPVMQLPVSAHMVGTTGLATLVSPTIQLLAPSGLRMLPGDPQPLALTVHSPHLPNTNVAHSPASAVVSHSRLRSGNANESSDTRTTAAITLPTLHLTNKMVAGSVALTAEAARLPGGAELNILPANGTVRAGTAGKHHPITLTGGLTLPNGVLGHAGVTLTTKSIAHTPGSEASGTVLTPAIHGAGTIPTHLASAAALDVPFISLKISLPR